MFPFLSVKNNKKIIWKSTETLLGLLSNESQIFLLSNESVHIKCFFPLLKCIYIYFYFSFTITTIVVRGTKLVILKVPFSSLISDILLTNLLFICVINKY